MSNMSTNSAFSSMYRPPHVQAQVKAQVKAKITPDIASEIAYPSLGKPVVKPVVKTPVILNYKKTVEATAARDEKERLAAEAAQAAKKSERASLAKPVPRRHIPSHCYDDGPQDDEIDYEEEDTRPDESDDEETGEFNAHLASGRRRGDKGIW